MSARFDQLSDTERQRIQDRMRMWAALTPAERGLARWVFQESRPLAGSGLDERWRAYRELDASERRRLAEQANRQATPTATLRRPDASPSPVPKTNLVHAPNADAPGKPVGPVVVMAPQGATTAPLGRSPAPTGLQQTAGQPKIAATSEFVDAQTLLPRVGPQAPPAIIAAAGTAGAAAAGAGDPAPAAPVPATPASEPAPGSSDKMEGSGGVAAASPSPAPPP